MTKHGGRYYLQYACPGTEFNVYADGVYVSESPLGPFAPAENNPFSMKPGGFMRGAGHGSTVEDKNGAWWHAATMQISMNHSFERRVGLWRAEMCIRDSVKGVPVKGERVLPGGLQHVELLLHRIPVEQHHREKQRKHNNGQGEQGKAADGPRRPRLFSTFQIEAPFVTVHNILPPGIVFLYVLHAIPFVQNL